MCLLVSLVANIRFYYKNVFTVTVFSQYLLCETYFNVLKKYGRVSNWLAPQPVLFFHTIYNVHFLHHQHDSTSNKFTDNKATTNLLQIEEPE